MIEKIEVIRGPASIIYGSDAMGGVINIITKKHTDKLASGIQLESKLFEPDSEWGNAYGANAYINTPLIKDKLSLNLRASGRFNEANKFLKPSWVSPSSNGNPYAAHSSTGSRNFMGGFRLNYTPTSRDYIYLDSEVYNGRLGSLILQAEVSLLYKSCLRSILRLATRGIMRGGSFLAMCSTLSISSPRTQMSLSVGAQASISTGQVSA